MTLSQAAWTLWGKTPSRFEQSSNVEQIGAKTWLSVAQHLRDSADVGEYLVREVLAPRVHRRIAAACGGSLEDAARLVAFLTGTHDVGKVEYCFQSQIKGSTEHGWLWEQVRDLPCCPSDQGWAPDPKPKHAEVSKLILLKELARRVPEATSGAIDTLVSVAGCHHGKPAVLGSPRVPGSRGRKLSLWLDAHGSAWHGLWTELVDDILERTGAQPVLERVLAAGGLSIQDQMLLSGVVTMADWIASNQVFFPLTESGRHHHDDSRADEALRQLNLTQAWQPSAQSDPPFHRRFGWPRSATLRPCQLTALEAARTVTGPTLLIIEEEMGQGKTEAALLAAEVLSGRLGAGGVAFALPTMATSDAMFARIKAWVETLSDLTEPAESGSPSTSTEPPDPSAETPPEGTGEVAPHSLFLGHSRSWLNPDNERLIRQTRAIDQNYSDPTRRDDRGRGKQRHLSEAVIAHEWFSGRRGMLAEFTVTTVDQILMTALATRYVTMRHLGLAGKTVILDEVHSYDVYTTAYMERTLTWLAAHDVSVILLSATLDSATRHSLERAYAAGLGVAPKPANSATGTGASTSRLGRPKSEVQRRRTEQGAEPAVVPPYPRVSLTNAEGTTALPIPPRETHRNVRVEFLNDDVATLLDLVAPLHEHGGIVGIVCNTVLRAQEVYAAIAPQFDDGEVSLHHSQFTASDRMRRDTQLVRDLGLTASRTDETRPWRRIVVGTQVLEQSLDVDFDVLITDLAPTDAVAQRAGRLHRHDRPPTDRPEVFRDATVYIRGVERSREIPVFDSGSTAIYGDRVLLASTAVLHSFEGRTWCLTHELEDAVERTYADGLDVPESWLAVYQEATKKERNKQQNARGNAEQFQLTTPAKSSGSLEKALDSMTVKDVDREESQAAAHVRDIEPSLDVLLVRARGDLLAPLPGALPTKAADQHWFLARTETPPSRFARAIAMSSIRLPQWLVPPWHMDAAIDELEAQGLPSWQQDFRLRGQLVIFLDDQLRGSVLGTAFGYDDRVGLHRLDDVFPDTSGSVAPIGRTAADPAVDDIDLDAEVLDNTIDITEKENPA